MGKKIAVTEQILQKIRFAVGDSKFDASNVSVFETRTLTTEAVKQRGFFDGARVTVQTLQALAATFKEKEGNSVPLIVMHEGNMLPVGTVFDADVFIMPNGETEMRTLFFVRNDEEGDYAAKLDSSVINEVSVGVQFEHAYCSECGFDYFGPDASIENYWNLECNEGHNIGMNGVHLRLVGVESWSELSLVNRGAAKEAKIMAEGRRKLAASASRSSSTVPVLNASFSMSEKSPQPTAKDDKDMRNETMTLANALGEEKAKVALAQKAETDALAQVSTLTTQLQEAKDRIKQLEDADAQRTELVAAKEKAESDLAAATEALKGHLEAAATAAGEKDAKIPETLLGQIEYVKEKGVKLHQLLGAGQGGSADPSKTELAKKAVDEDILAKARTASFKSK